MEATKLSLQTTQFSILSKFRAPSIADGSPFSENSQNLGRDVNIHKLSVGNQHSVGIAQTLGLRSKFTHQLTACFPLRRYFLYFWLTLSLSLSLYVFKNFTNRTCTLLNYHQYSERNKTEI